MAKTKAQNGNEGAATAHIAKNATCAPAAGGQSPPLQELITDVAELAAERREIIEQQLVEGGTFEDAQEAANEGQAAPVSLRAVQTYFQRSMELQKRRVERQLERAAVLRSAFADPDSAEAELASATVLMGLQCLNRQPSLPLKESVKSGMELRIKELERQLAKAKLMREREAMEFARSKRRAEETRRRLAQVKLVKLRRELDRRGSKRLGREAVAAIKEIYGLMQVPVPIDMAESPDQLPADACVVKKLADLPPGIDE